MLMGLAFVGLGASSASPAVATIASTIQTVEGYYPGSLAYNDNNPGNLIFNNQAGATKGPPMAGTPYFYAVFPSYDDGYQALVNQINTYANQGLTINQMMAKYAPATDANGNPTTNNPTSYANQIATALGVSADATLSDALAGNATAGIPAPDTSTLFNSATDPVTSLFTDVGSAISDGSISDITDGDWGTLAAGVAILIAGWMVFTR
jgi:hypothetical protein